MSQTITRIAALLSVSEVSVHFGGIVALDGISFEVLRGQICGVIGPNGAGKTTLFNCLSRLYTPLAGSIKFDGENLLSKKQHDIAAAGIGRTFQNVALFPSMTVRENVMVGFHCRTTTGYIANALRLASVRREDKQVRSRTDHLLELLNLADLADTAVKNLSFGTRKRVEMARALVADPKLLLLDEPAAGLGQDDIDKFANLLIQLRKKCAIAIVEHHVDFIGAISDQVYVLNFGKVISSGSFDTVKRDPAVLAAYLGTSQQTGSEKLGGAHA